MFPSNFFEDGIIPLLSYEVLNRIFLFVMLPVSIVIIKAHVSLKGCAILNRFQLWSE